MLKEITVLIIIISIAMYVRCNDVVEILVAKEVRCYLLH